MSQSSLKAKALVALAILVLTSLAACSKSDESQLVEYGKLGVESYENGELALAVEYLERAVEQDHTDALLYAVLGSVYYEMEKYDRALENLDRAIELGTDSEVAYLRRADIQRSRGQARLSISNYNHAFDLIQTSSGQAPTVSLADVYLGRGAAYFIVEDFEGLPMILRNF